MPAHGGFNVHDRQDVQRSRDRVARHIKFLGGELHRARALLARRDRQLKALQPKSQRAQVVKFLLARVGRHEDAGRQNRAKWLDAWARKVGEWMVGQPWCGLTVWMACRAAGLKLDPRTVSTVAIRDMAKAGTGGFARWVPWSDVQAGRYKLEPGDVLIYGTPASGPVHTGVFVGGGKVAEGNTSPGRGGSQNDGGGLYLRDLSDRAGWILGVAIPAYT